MLAALPAVGEDDDDGPPGRPALPPAVDERAQHLAQPGAARPVRDGLAPPRRSARSGSRIRSSRVTRVSRVPRVKASTARGRAADHDVREAQQRVGVGLHRAGDVDQQHDLARPPGPVAAAQLAQLAVVAQRGAQRAPRVGAAVRGPGAAAATARVGRSGRSRASSRRRCSRSAGGELGEVAVAQHLGAAGPRVDAAGRPALLARLAGVVRDERGELRRRWRSLVARSGCGRRCAGVEPVRERLVVAGQVVRVGAQGEPAGPVGLQSGSVTSSASSADEERGHPVGGDRPARRCAARP